jgi:hypothetical protein
MKKCLGWLLVSSALVAGCGSRAATLKPATANAAAPAILWRHPERIASRDLFWGSGHPSRVPRGPFRFVEEDATGKNPKITVTDARGRTWDVKFGDEVHAEIAANRLVWALGYLVEDQYFVRTGVVTGARRLDRAAAHVDSNGRFRDARFRWRNPATPRTGEEWTLKQNPFVGSREMSGLHILMTMINNWDIDGARNNKVLRAVSPAGRAERRFLIADLGATFGRMGGGLLSNHSKWTLAHFKEEKFIAGVGRGMLDLAYDGYDRDIDRVPLDHARWFAALASQLRPPQLRRAFQAAGASMEEVDGYTAKLREKIAALDQAVAAAR